MSRRPAFRVFMSEHDGGKLIGVLMQIGRAHV